MSFKNVFLNRPHLRTLGTADRKRSHWKDFSEIFQISYFDVLYLISYTI